MATEKLLLQDTITATADLTGAQYKLVTSAGVVAGTAGISSFPLQNAPANGGRADIGIVGISKVVYGGTIAVGAKLATTAAGLALTATTGQTVVGVARVAGAINDVGSMYIATPGGLA